MGREGERLGVVRGDSNKKGKVTVVRWVKRKKKDRRMEKLESIEGGEGGRDAGKGRGAKGETEDKAEGS